MRHADLSKKKKYLVVKTKKNEDQMISFLELARAQTRWSHALICVGRQVDLQRQGGFIIVYK